jgi:MIP family channel proteins
MVLSFDKYLAEGLATLILVFVGAGAVLINISTNNGLGILGIAIAYGLALTAGLYAITHISGGHINPAVTIAMWATRKIKTVDAVGYIIAQLIGSAIAAVGLQAVFAFSPPTAYLGTPQLANLVSPTTGVLIEALLTAFLVFVIFGTVVDKRASEHHAPLAIGATLVFGSLVGLALTGAALNPARAFGPALITGYWVNQAVYWIGPIIGALVAAFIYEYGLLKSKRAEVRSARK